MKLLIDTHTHTLYSGHAKGTVGEHAAEAARKGLKAFVVADHGPKIYRHDDMKWLTGYCNLPKELYGVRIVKGAEANIVDYAGNTDLPQEWIDCLEFMLAGFHAGTITPGNADDYTAALAGALRDPKVDVISHPGNPGFPIDIDFIVKLAGEQGKMLEINNSSVYSRKGSEENCLAILRSCKRQGVRIVTASDCHITADIGSFDVVQEMLEQVKMPPELVLTANPEQFFEYLETRKKRINIANDKY